jgi:hypothetical protein
VVLSSLEARKGQGVPEWMTQRRQLTGACSTSRPGLDPVPINEQLIVELYSK